MQSPDAYRLTSPSPIYSNISVPCSVIHVLNLLLYVYCRMEQALFRSLTLGLSGACACGAGADTTDKQMWKPLSDCFRRDAMFGVDDLVEQSLNCSPLFVDLPIGSRVLLW